MSSFRKQHLRWFGKCGTKGYMSLREKASLQKSSRALSKGKGGILKISSVDVSLHKETISPLLVVIITLLLLRLGNAYLTDLQSFLFQLSRTIRRSPICSNMDAVSQTWQSKSALSCSYTTLTSAVLPDPPIPTTNMALYACSKSKEQFLLDAQQKLKLDEVTKRPAA
ncbi:hypothetical protein AAHA92_25790 [Salvia divinorum]|uniref:Uncharacterized protein n=1 Tax=Salvia divinorum TaxID=28513 RepID=A0ABD1GC05_SALDI